MELKLTVYEDETMKEVKKVYEADRLKIPYRVAMTIITSLDNVNLDETDDVLKLLTSSAGMVDKIIKVTFGVSESELDCVDAGELVAVVTELYKWGIEKMHSLNKGNAEKNVMATM